MLLQCTAGFVNHHATAISFAITTGAAQAIIDGVSRMETRRAGGAGRSPANGAES